MKDLGQMLEALEKVRIAGEIKNDWEYSFIEDNYEKFTGIYNRDTTNFSPKVAEKIAELYVRRG